MQQWYVLRSKPHKEDALDRHAREQGHEVYCPRIPVKPANPRARKTRPYFPGYLFVRSDPARVGDSTFRWMPFSQGLVHVGEEPAPVADGFVRALRARLAAIRDAGGLPSDGLRQGDRVVLRAGIFKGYEAIFDARLAGKERARLLLKMIGDRHVRIEVHIGLLEQAGLQREPTRSVAGM